MSSLYQPDGAPEETPDDRREAANPLAELAWEAAETVINGLIEGFLSS